MDSKQMVNQRKPSVTLKSTWAGGVMNLKSPKTGKIYIYNPESGSELTNVDADDASWLLSLTYGTGQDAATRVHYFTL